MKKDKMELDMDAYLKAFNKKPSTFQTIIGVLMVIWSTLFGLTTFLVLTKLMVMAWSWLL